MLWIGCTLLPQDGSRKVPTTALCSFVGDKKTIIVSAPTIKGHSRIETEFLKSTQEEWTVPCPGCGHYQPLVWSGIKYDKDDLTRPILYECERCGEVFGEYEWKNATVGRHGDDRRGHEERAAFTLKSCEDENGIYRMILERVRQG